MNKIKLLGAVLTGALAFGSTITAANSDPRAVLESSPCVLTLPSKVITVSSEFNQYESGIQDSKNIKTTFITSDMLVCPVGVEPNFNSGTFRGHDDWQRPFQFASSTNPIAGARFYWIYFNVFDSVVNEIVYKQAWVIEGDSGAFDSIVTGGDGGAKPYLTIDGKNYELKLAKSFELADGYKTSTESCVLTMPNLTKHYSDPTGERNTTYISRSNLSCPAETNGHELSINWYEENDNSSNVTFLDEQGNELALEYCYRSKLDLEVGVFARGNVPCLHSYGKLGVFVKAKANSKIYDRLTGKTYSVVLAAPFQVKRATDVTAKVKRSGSFLNIKINADRNYSVDNGRGHTNKRQTVIAKDKADRAIVKRGNKVIAIVKLSIYGNGKVKIKDIAGKNNYTVTLIETDGNYAGVASFKK